MRKSTSKKSSFKDFLTYFLYAAVRKSLKERYKERYEENEYRTLRRQLGDFMKWLKNHPWDKEELIDLCRKGLTDCTSVGLRNILTEHILKQIEVFQNKNAFSDNGISENSKKTKQALNNEVNNAIDKPSPGKACKIFQSKVRKSLKSFQSTELKLGGVKALKNLKALPAENLCKPPCFSYNTFFKKKHPFPFSSISSGKLVPNLGIPESVYRFLVKEKIHTKSVQVLVLNSQNTQDFAKALMLLKSHGLKSFNENTREKIYFMVYKVTQQDDPVKLAHNLVAQSRGSNLFETIDRFWPNLFDSPDPISLKLDLKNVKLKLNL